jgi:hypothetical protein
MKKTIGKLSVSKRTISNLTHYTLQLARGGVLVAQQDTKQEIQIGPGNSRVSCADKTCETTVVGDICACYTTCPCPDNPAY